MTNTVLGLKVTTDGEIQELKSISLQTLQEGVGGWVQAIDLRPDVTMWINEEGKLEGLPLNTVAQALWNQVFGQTDYIVGNAVFTGGTDEDGETLPLSRERANEIRAVTLEYFIRAK
jgi:hypothetical protein